jgi:two-component system, chemotaxis family, sensor kinase Cph1
MESANQLSDLANDLKACEREPLQFIGSIQGFGGLIAFTMTDQRIQTASENIKDLTSVAHGEAIGAKLGHIIGNKNASDVIDACRDITMNEPRVSVALSMGGSDYDGSVFVTDGLHFLEFEKLDDGYGDLKTRLRQEDELKRCLSELRTSRKLEQQGFAVCRSVQRITGMDRVMLYRFLEPHMHGEVIAEHRVLSAHSFYQHRFPASDIPRIARDLYLRNGVRIIPDTEMPIHSVSPAKNPLTGKALDLSDSRLRAVSPVHIEYLRNMRVRCSFSVAVIVEGKLWGLIACHHLSPKRITISQRNACEVIAGAFAGQAGVSEISVQQGTEIDFSRKMRDLLDSMIVSRDPVDELMKRHQTLLEGFRATGAALVKAKSCDLVGLTPMREQVMALAQVLADKMKANHTEAIAVDSVADQFPKVQEGLQLASGVLSVSVGPDMQLMIFRPEQIETVVWGGDPRKQLERKGFEGRINPRASFETWEETIKNRSQPWQEFEIEGFKHLATTIFSRLTLATR